MMYHSQGISTGNIFTEICCLSSLHSCIDIALGAYTNLSRNYGIPTLGGCSFSCFASKQKNKKS